MMATKRGNPVQSAAGRTVKAKDAHRLRKSSKKATIKMSREDEDIVNQNLLGFSARGTNRA